MTVNFTTWKGITDGQTYGIPDREVSRPDDNDSFNTSASFGIRIKSGEDWPEEFDAEISTNTGNITRAYIYDVSDGSLVSDVDVSSLSSGDIVTFDLGDGQLDADQDYNVVADAEGDTVDYGRFNDPDLPYESDDGKLSIVDGASGEQDTSGNVNTFVRVGNLQ